MDLSFYIWLSLFDSLAAGPGWVAVGGLLELSETATKAILFSLVSVESHAQSWQCFIIEVKYLQPWPADAKADAKAISKAL